MKPLKRLDPTWWRKAADGYDQQDGRARLVRLKTGAKITGWSLYVDGECLGSWPSLREAKEHAAKPIEPCTCGCTARWTLCRFCGNPDPRST